MTLQRTLLSTASLALCLAAQPGLAEAPEGPPQAPSADLVADEAGRFSVPVPGGWAAETQGSAVLLTSPEKGIELRVASFDRAEPRDLLAAMWGLADPTFAAPPPEGASIPSREGVEETWLYDYRMIDGTVLQAVVELGGGSGYVTLIKGDLEEIGRRQAQIMTVLTGMAIEGVEALDLSNATPRLDAADLEALRDHIREGMAAMQVPGTAVAVVQDGEVVLLEGFGVREQGGDAPVTPATRMMIGSTGKTMTSMLVARLVDQGRLAWDSPVRSVLPQFAVADPALSEAFTIRHLLCACTGVPRRDWEIVFNADELSAEDVVGSLSTFQVFTGFGETFQYSNQLVATAGWAAASAAGAEWGRLNEGYAEVLGEEILAPIGMTATTFSIATAVASGNHASPHDVSFGGPRRLMDPKEERVLSPIAPAGTAWSTAEDMSRYLRTVMSAGTAPDGTVVASREALIEAWAPQVGITADMSYGLGWMIEDWHGQRLLHHGGNTLGFTSDLAFLPEAGLGVVVLANARSANDFAQSVRWRLFELAFDLPTKAGADARLSHEHGTAEMARLSAAGAVDAMAVEGHLGAYRNESLGEVTLSQMGESLRLDVGEFAMTIRSAEGIEGLPTAYVVVDGPLPGTPVDLELDEHGQPVIVFGHGVTEYRFTLEP